MENAQYRGPLGKYHPDNTEPVIPNELSEGYMTPEQLSAFEPALPGVYAQPGFRLHKLAAEQTYPSTTDPFSLNKAFVTGKVGQKSAVTDLGRSVLPTGPQP